MTLRAGSYDASRPRRRGIIRNDGSPWYSCDHEHASFPEARECAKAALPVIREREKSGPGVLLPEGWHVHRREFHSGQ